MHGNKTKIYKFKVHDNIRWNEFCLGSISKYFMENEQSEISLNGSEYEFSLNHSWIEK